MIGQDSSQQYILIYYTGKKPLLLSTKIPTNVFIFKQRPALRTVISSLVYATETKEALPEDLVHIHSAEMKDMDVRPLVSLLRSRHA